MTSLITFKPREFHVEDYNSNDGGVIKLRVEAPDIPLQSHRFAKRGAKQVSKRDKVRGFSSRSRKNISDHLQILDYQALTDNDRLKAKFVTLTYPKSFPDIKQAKRHRDNFFKRIKRLYPKCSAIWRLELQKRGAPHFHIILFNLLYLEKEKLADMWLEIIGDEFADYSQGFKRAPMTRIESIRSFRGCASYVSKYISKKDGTEGTLSNPFEGAGFNSLPYLTAERYKSNIDLIEKVINRALEAGEEPEKGSDRNDKLWVSIMLKQYLTKDELDVLCPSTGRLWGIHNKENLINLNNLKKSFVFDVETIRALKEFCAWYRGGNFNRNLDDGGFTFYFNSQIERTAFYNVMQIMLDKVVS